MTKLVNVLQASVGETEIHRVTMYIECGLRMLEITMLRSDELASSNQDSLVIHLLNAACFLFVDIMMLVALICSCV